jgi:hypothetical protein
VSAVTEVLMGEVQSAGAYIPEMPYLPEQQVVSPFVFARTCLFSASQLQGFACLPSFTESSPPLYSRHGVVVQQTQGRRLEKQHEDVALELMRRALLIASPGAREVRVHVTRPALLKSLSWAHGGSVNAALAACLNDLADARFVITLPLPNGDGVRTVRTGICLKLDTLETRQGPKRTAVEYEILVDVELTTLLEFNQWCYLDPKVRAKLSKSPVAKLLHAYFSSYSVGRWISMDELREMADRDEMTVVLKGKATREEVVRQRERDGRWRKKVQKNIDELAKADPRWQLRLDKDSNRVYCDAKPGKGGAVATSKKPGAKPAAKQPAKQASTQSPLTQWLESLPMEQLELLPSALGYLYGLPPGWTPEERRTAILEDFMDEKHSLEEMQQRLAKALRTADKDI